MKLTVTSLLLFVGSSLALPKPSDSTAIRADDQSTYGKHRPKHATAEALEQKNDAGANNVMTSSQALASKTHLAHKLQRSERTLIQTGLKAMRASGKPTLSLARGGRISGGASQPMLTARTHAVVSLEELTADTTRKIRTLTNKPSDVYKREFIEAFRPALNETLSTHFDAFLLSMMAHQVEPHGGLHAEGLAQVERLLLESAQKHLDHDAELKTASANFLAAHNTTYGPMAHEALIQHSLVSARAAAAECVHARTSRAIWMLLRARHARMPVCRYHHSCLALIPPLTPGACTLCGVLSLLAARRRRDPRRFRTTPDPRGPDVEGE